MQYLQIASNAIRRIWHPTHYQNNVFGVDIDEEALEILRYRLFSTALYEFSFKLTKKDLKNFKLGNTISDDTFLWEKEFGIVFKKEDLTVS